jgi:hypothetical protein
VRGVYRREVDSSYEVPVVYYNGTHFLLPGWECELSPTDEDGSFSINVNKIKELLWAEPREKPMNTPQDSAWIDGFYRVMHRLVCEVQRDGDVSRERVSQIIKQEYEQPTNQTPIHPPPADA